MIHPLGLWRRQCLRYSSSAWLQKPGIAHLKRAVIKLTGPETIKYLQGMCTSNIFKWQADGLTGAHYTCFLNPHGRLMHEAFLIGSKGTDEEIYIDCDETTAFELDFHLKQYRLRNKVQIFNETDKWQVVATWNGAETPKDAQFIFEDRRCDWQMRRMLVPRESISQDTKELSSAAAFYDFLRMLKGIPEACRELPRGKAIPMEANMDLMGAIDLHKGCYMGQELVTRTLQRGVVRKRIVPIQLFSYDQKSIADYTPQMDALDLDGVSQETDLMKIEPDTANNIREVSNIDPKAKFGKIVRVLGNVGLALVRLEEMPHGGLFVLQRSHPSALTTGLIANSVGQPMLVMGRAFIPSWWPPQVKSD